MFWFSRRNSHRVSIRIRSSITEFILGLILTNSHELVLGSSAECYESLSHVISTLKPDAGSGRWQKMELRDLDYLLVPPFPRLSYKQVLPKLSNKKEAKKTVIFAMFCGLRGGEGGMKSYCGPGCISVAFGTGAVWVTGFSGSTTY